MSLENNLRGSNVTLKVAIDGQPQLGSFNGVESFTFQAMQEVDQLKFLGKATHTFDRRHNGWQVNFTIVESDSQAVKNYLSPLATQYEAGNTMPRVTLTFLKSHRGSPEVDVFVFNDVALIHSGSPSDDADGFLKTSFQGFCEHMDQI